MHNDGGTGAANIMRQADLRINLPSSSFSANLLNYFTDLLDSCRSDGVAACLQASAGIHGECSAKGRDPLFRKPACLAFLAEPEVLDGADLGNGEAD
jgi:hypothetical protein